MTLKSSLFIGGDASEAVAALNAADAAIAGNEAQAEKLAAAYQRTDAAIKKLATAQATAKREIDAAKASLQAGEVSLEQYNQALLQTKTGLGLVEAEHRIAAAELRKFAAANDDVGARIAGMSRGAKAAFTDLSRQWQDVGVMMSSGANLGTIVTLQGSQIADALSRTEGRFQKLGSFLMGGWGTALIMATGFVMNFVGSLLESEDAAEKAATATDMFGQAQSVLGPIVDELTGKINSQNQALLVNAQLMANQMRAKAAQARLDFSAAVRKGQSYTAMESMAADLPISDNPDRDPAGKILNDLQAGRITSLEASKRAGALKSKGPRIGQQEVYKAIDDYIVMTTGPQAADQIETYLAGKGKPTKFKSGRIGSKAKGPSGASLSEFGEDFGKKLADLRGQFSDAPALVEKTRKALAEVADLENDIGRKKGLSLQAQSALKAEIEATRSAIEDGMNKPFNDFMEQQRQSAAIDALMVQGRDDEAAALQIVLRLKDQQGPLDDAQLAAVLKTVEAERQRGKVLRDQRALIEANLNAVSDLRAGMEGVVSDALQGQLSIGKLVGTIRNSISQIIAKQFTQTYFGDALRDLEDQASGTKRVDAAGKSMADSMDIGSAAVVDFANTVHRLLPSMQPPGSPGSGPTSSSPWGLMDPYYDGGPLQGQPSLGLLDPYFDFGMDPEEIVVSGVKAQKAASKDTIQAMSSTDFFAAMRNSFSRGLENLAGPLAKPISGALFGAAIGGKGGAVLGGIGGLGLGRASLLANSALSGLQMSAIATSFGLNGTGAAIGGITGALLGGGANAILPGLGPLAGALFGGAIGKGKGSLIGAGLGGAIAATGATHALAGALGLGPIGLTVFGGLLIGALIGSLFKKAKYGNVAFNNGVSSINGNNADMKNAAGQAGDDVTGNLEKIAEALGGSLGGFNVSLGQTDGKWRISTTGRTGELKSKYSDVQVFGKGDAAYAQALRAALADAISDGAVQGISAAMQKALKSSADIDAAIKEALKVQQIEVLIGGIGGEMKKAFADFEKQAAERLRIARDYGFDVIEMEKRNAEDRLKLSEKMLAEQVGSLQQLIDDMTSGSLFEGSSVDRRSALLDKIAAARTDAAAGKAGAADTLANLLDQLNSVSREVYGTTGGFAEDRASILDQARSVIAAANQRIADAQVTSDPALATTNAALDENNDQNAQIIALLQAQGLALGQIAGTGSYDWSNVYSLAGTAPL